MSKYTSDYAQSEMSRAVNGDKPPKGIKVLRRAKKETVDEQKRRKGFSQTKSNQEMKKRKNTPPRQKRL